MRGPGALVTVFPSLAFGIGTAAGILVVGKVSRCADAADGRSLTMMHSMVQSRKHPHRKAHGCSPPNGGS
jgi:hypothetical protein